jgi:hypothetical protein
MTIVPCYLHVPQGLTVSEVLSGINSHANRQDVVLTADEEHNDLEAPEGTRIYTRSAFDGILFEEEIDLEP